MDYFPKESVNRAKEIAHLYNLRGHSQLAKASQLYRGHFIHLHYGFNDAIKSGRCTTYLHEARTDVECFSMAGINYLVAKECGLKPKICSAVNLVDVDEGENIKDQMKADHAFITVLINGKEFVLDPSCTAFGRITKKEDGVITIDNHGKEDHQITERRFQTLTTMSERDYVTRLEEDRKPEFGKRTLCGAQYVAYKKGRVGIQYVPKQRRLHSFVIASYCDNIIEETASRNGIFELIAPLDADGNWHTEDGKIRCFFSRSRGWSLDQHGLAHCEMIFPIGIVEKYISNLQTAAEYFGRKTPLERLNSLKEEDYFEDIGFSSTGEVIKENGVDKTKHTKLLEQMLLSAPLGREPKEAMPSIHQRSVYNALSEKAKTSSNKRGFLYTQKERDELTDEFMSLVRKKYEGYTELVIKKIYAKAKLIPNLKRESKNLRVLLNRRSSVETFMEFLGIRKLRRDAYERRIDYALFQRENPKGTIVSTKEQQLEYYKTLSFFYIMNLVKALPNLRLLDFRKGLQRILKE